MTAAEGKPPWWSKMVNRAPHADGRWRSIQVRRGRGRVLVSRSPEEQERVRKGGSSISSENSRNPKPVEKTKKSPRSSPGKRQDIDSGEREAIQKRRSFLEEGDLGGDSSNWNGGLKKKETHSLTAGGEKERSTILYKRLKKKRSLL